MNPNDQKDVTSDKQVSPWYTNFLLPAGLIVLLLLAGALYFGYQSYSASKVPKLPTESPSNINYPQVSASGVSIGKSETAMNLEWLNQARKLGDVSLCKKITAEKDRQACLDNIIAGEASKTGNISMCDKLSTEEGKIACRNPLYYREAVLSKNKEICKKIANNDDYREQCVSKIILDQVAVTSTGKLDVSVCDMVSSEYQEKCKNSVQSQNSLNAFLEAQSSSDLVGCNSIENVTLRDSCQNQLLTRKAQENLDISLCVKLSDQTQKDICQTSVIRSLDASYDRDARSDGDVSLCEKIQDKDRKISCSDAIYISQALTAKNKTICDNISQMDQKGLCQSLIK